MSDVKVRERHDTKVQFIENARLLVIHTFQCCRKFPKSAMFYVTKDLASYAKEIYRCVITANEYFPKNANDIQMRKQYFEKALGYLASMVCFIGIARDTYNSLELSDYAWVHWGELILSETKLIKKILSSDEKTLVNIGNIPNVSPLCE